MSPTVFETMLCGQWSGAAPPGASLVVKCAEDLPPARYVVVLGQADALNICELEVYGKGKKLK